MATVATVVVPGGNGGCTRPILLAEEEIAGSEVEDSEPDAGDENPGAADGNPPGSGRPSSQSLPRSYRLPQSTAGSGSSILAAEAAAYSARKVDSLPGNLVKRISMSTTGTSTSPGSSSSTDRSTAGKKRSTGRLLKSFGQFVQKVARQLTTSLNVQSFANGGSGSSNGGRSKTPTRQQNDAKNVASCPAGDGTIDRLANGDAEGTSMLPLGVVGIHNHGNTCFMNAVLQCLANTAPLASYLVTEKYRADVRRCARRNSNLRPGSTRGELTESLATLVQALWRRTITSDVSSEFRAMVARHGAQYRGCAQHDAQEFLLWLLDQVHEDVNIATKKKYRANKSSIGRPDEAVAAEALANHTRCNNSFIYDLFQALYRSSLTCPSCHHRSNTFDPFLSVSLPIPHKSQQPAFVTVVRSLVPSDGTPMRRVKMGFLVDPEETVNELRRAVADGTKIAKESLVLFEVDDSGFSRTLCDSNPLCELGESPEVYAVEVEYNRRHSTCDKITAIILNRDHTTGLRFGPLLVVRLAKDSRSADIKAAVRDELSQICQVSFPAEMDGPMQLQQAGSSTISFNLLADDVERPLQNDGIARAFNFQVHGSGPSHLQLIAEWSTQARERVESSSVADDVVEHETVEQVKIAPQQSPVGTLDECFQIYTQEERLGADDAWLCPNCRKYQQDTVKALSLWSLPEIFIIHLKRFKQDASQRYKLNTLVMFPVTGLDMSRHVQRPTAAAATPGSWSDSGSMATSPGVGSPHSRTSSTSSVSAWLTWKPGRKVPDSANDYVYDLYAVCNHYGNMQGGHYTAFCKNAATNHWYSFNDSKATEMREEEVVTRAAYLLFYQRRSAASSGDGSAAGHEWLAQLRSLANNGIPRTVTSHSLDNLLDSDGSTSSSHVTEDALAHRNVELYATMRKPAVNGHRGLTDSAPAVDVSTETDDEVFHTPKGNNPVEDKSRSSSTTAGAVNGGGDEHGTTTTTPMSVDVANSLSSAKRCDDLSKSSCGSEAIPPTTQTTSGPTTMANGFGKSPKPDDRRSRPDARAADVGKSPLGRRT